MDSMFLIKKGACAVAKDIAFAFHLEGEMDMLQKRLLMPLWTRGSRLW